MKSPLLLPGTGLIVEITVEGVLLKLARVLLPSSIERVFDSLKHRGAALSIEDMETAVAA